MSANTLCSACQGGCLYVLYLRWMSRRSCDTRHFRMIISTGGIPSACNRLLILSSNRCFSSEGISIHLVHSS